MMPKFLQRHCKLRTLCRCRLCLFGACTSGLHLGMVANGCCLVSCCADSCCAALLLSVTVQESESLRANHLQGLLRQQQHHCSNAHNSSATAVMACALLLASIGSSQVVHLDTCRTNLWLRLFCCAPADDFCAAQAAPADDLNMLWQKVFKHTFTSAWHVSERPCMAVTHSQ
jgi:hypothetical protein